MREPGGGRADGRHGVEVGRERSGREPGTGERADRRGTLAVLAAAACYATLPILVKLALAAGARIWPLVAWRFLIGSALVWLYIALGRRPLPPAAAAPALLGLGALYACNALAYLVGLQWVPAATASLLFYSYPAVVVLLAAVFLRERLGRRRLLALLLALSGCGLTAGAGIHGGQPRGIALILAGVALISAFILLSHAVLRRLPTLGATAVSLTATAAVAAAAATATGGFGLGGGSGTALLAVLLGLLATALPIPLFLAGIQAVGPGRAVILSTVEPVLTVVLAAALLGETIAAGQVAGGALIVAAVVWLRTERPLPESERPAPLESP